MASWYSTAIATSAFALLAGCASKPALPSFGVVPDFTLTDQTGAKFSSAELNKKVWIADFVFTNCPGPCPRMSSQMRQVQEKTPADVKLVSFTVDPERDTPPVLAAYAKHFKYDPARWWFLTGEQAKLSSLGRDGFLLNPVDVSLTHSTRFVLVDRRRRIRGFYSTSEEDFLSNLLRDIQTLRNEAP